MGSKYTNVCLKGADQLAAIALLDEWRRRARYASAPQHFEDAAEFPDRDEIDGARRESRARRCAEAALIFGRFRATLRSRCE